MGGGLPRVAIALTVSSSTANYNIFTNRGGTYAAGRSDITLTINSGVNVYSTSVGTPGLTVGGFTTGDTVKIVNNGTIAGKGGDGNAEAGGTALSTAFATSITNNGTVQGGGGGGAPGPSFYCCYCGQPRSYGAGGGGGGAGINAGAGGGGFAGGCGNGCSGCPGGPINGGPGGHAYAGYGVTGGNRGAAGSYGAGSCTVGNAYITWTVIGNRYGPLN